MNCNLRSQTPALIPVLLYNKCIYSVFLIEMFSCDFDEQIQFSLQLLTECPRWRATCPHRKAQSSRRRFWIVCPMLNASMSLAADSCDGRYKNVSFFYAIKNKNISADWKTRDFVVVGIGVPVCILILLANLLVMVAIIINRRFHFPIYYLLGNMAAADLFAGISYLNLIFHTGPWTIGLTQNEWLVRGALIEMSLTASVVNLLAVAWERHQSIFTMQLHSTMSNRRVLMFIVGIWVIAIIMGLVPTMGWNCVCNIQACSTVAPLYARSFLVFWAILNLLTFSIMVAIYTRIFVYVHRKSQSTLPYTLNVRQNDTLVGLMKTVSMILGNVDLFIIVISS